MKKFPNQTVERLTALRGILNMHERAIKAKKACKLNGERRTFMMNVWDCGTSACALGSCAINPWFKERGLHLGVNPNLTPKDRMYIVPEYDGRIELGAAEAFFGITHNEADYIFYDSYPVDLMDVTPAMVRDRVEEIIKKYSEASNA